MGIEESDMETIRGSYPVGKNLDKYIGNIGISLVEAMKMIDSNSRGIIYVVDDDGGFVGSLSDGDIRRWLLRTGNLNCKVAEIVCSKAEYLYESDVLNAQMILDAKQLKSVPILDTERKITDIIFRDDGIQYGKSFDRKALNNTPVIIMAGGKGTRLYPYTKILPKPLIPIKEIPIIERIMDRLFMYGVLKFYLIVNYKKEMIKSYFAETKKCYDIVFVDEEIPLGTAGGITLIDEDFEDPVIVTNCDTLIDMDYCDALNYHLSSGNEMTIISSLKRTSIPYGVLHTKEEGRVISMEEKPELSYMINTGMYFVDGKVLKSMKKGKFIHMTNLAESLIADGKLVGMYPIGEDSFLDMGQFKEMKRMEEFISG